MLTWPTTSKKETFYLFGLWQTSKLDNKGAREGRSHIQFQGGTPELACLMVLNSHEQWYGTVLYEQESCVPHHGHFASLGK